MNNSLITPTPAKKMKLLNYPPQPILLIAFTLTIGFLVYLSYNKTTISASNFSKNPSKYLTKEIKITKVWYTNILNMSENYKTQGLSLKNKSEEFDVTYPINEDAKDYYYRKIKIYKDTITLKIPHKIASEIPDLKFGYIDIKGKVLSKELIEVSQIIEVPYSYQ